MKNIHEIAKDFNLFTESNLPKDYQDYWNTNMNDYRKAKGIVIPEFILNSPNYESGLFFRCDIQDKGTEKEYKYIEHSYILVKHKDSNLLLMLQRNRQDKYYLYPYYGLLHKYHSISSYEIAAVRNSLTEPMYIGVFSEKKLFAWVEYCINYVNASEAKYNEITSKTNDKEKEVKDFIASLNGNCEVMEYKETWYIKTKLFDITFNLDKQSGYLSKKITFNGTLEDITKIEKN